jgi:NitT/TauT family transport system permease protein
VSVQNTFGRSLVAVRSWPFFTDVIVGACGLAVFFAVVRIGSYWFGQPVPAVTISHSVSALPLYAFYSIVRIGIAYVLSLVFAVGSTSCSRSRS